MLVATLLTSALALAVFGSILWRLTPREERWLTVGCVVATLPMCWLMFHAVRMPLDGWLTSVLGDGDLLAWIRTAYAPLLEEPAKLWPLVFPQVRGAITRASVGRISLALGLGFALGEIFTVADLMATKTPEITRLPWYLLGGFVSERLATCAIHSGMTGIALAVWDRRKSLAGGLLLAMLAHYVANFPIAMSRWGWLGTNATIALLAVFAWTGILFSAALAWVAWLHVGRAQIGTLFYGRAVCPSCGKNYDRPLSGVNLGINLRYERCPYCKKWHWTTAVASP